MRNHREKSWIILIRRNGYLKQRFNRFSIGREADHAGQAFNVKLQNNTAVLKGVVSRKKQIVPVLTDALK